jgi:outer membrane lipoprotein SlyB
LEIARTAFLEANLLAIGCFVPIVLVVVGAVVGSAVGGTHAAILGIVAGGVTGAAAMILLLRVWERIRRRQL